jgi:hypothetical protein
MVKKEYFFYAASLSRFLQLDIGDFLTLTLWYEVLPTTNSVATFGISFSFCHFKQLLVYM